MKKLLMYFILTIMSLSIVSAATIVSDTTTEVNDGGWVNAVAAWVHPGWNSNINIADATWIWSSEYVSQDEAVNGVTRDFRKTFDVPQCSIIEGQIELSTDNSYVAKINGNEVGSDGNWQNSETIDISSYLTTGLNTLEITAVNEGMNGGTPTSNPAGLIYRIDINDCETEEVPEFGTIGAMLALAGIGYTIRKNRK